MSAPVPDSQNLDEMPYIPGKIESMESIAENEMSNSHQLQTKKSDIQEFLQTDKENVPVSF